MTEIVSNDAELCLLSQLGLMGLTGAVEQNDFEVAPFVAFDIM